MLDNAGDVRLHQRTHRDLNVFYTNVDGLPNKMDELLLNIEDYKPDVIVLTECIKSPIKASFSVLFFCWRQLQVLSEL